MPPFRTVGDDDVHHVLTDPGFSGIRQRSYPRDEKVELIEVALRTLDEVVPGDQRIASR
jgi:hypothetical protein